VEALIARLPAVEAKDPYACRARAERYFTHRRMGEEYLRFYGAYLASGVLPEGVRSKE
jgi:hypothetical protein